MKIIGRNLLGLYLCVPDEIEIKRAMGKPYLALYLGCRTGFYITPPSGKVI